MATDVQRQEAERLAAHAAMHAFIETLHTELEKLEEETVMGALGRSKHVHYALVTGRDQGIIKFEITFDDSAWAASAALQALVGTAAGKGPP